MLTQPTSVVVVGADSPQGEAWLRARFPSAPQNPEGLLLRRPGAELDAIVWAEELRFDAKRAGVRLSIGIAERDPAILLRDVIAAANRAVERARLLGGDITLAHSTLLHAP